MICGYEWNIILPEIKYNSHKVVTLEQAFYIYRESGSSGGVRHVAPPSFHRGLAQTNQTVALEWGNHILAL